MQPIGYYFWNGSTASSWGMKGPTVKIGPTWPSDWNDGGIST